MCATRRPVHSVELFGDRNIMDQKQAYIRTYYISVIPFTVKNYIKLCQDCQRLVVVDVKNLYLMKVLM